MIAPVKPGLTWAGWYWLAWMLAALIPELIWVFTNTSNTLSRQIWGAEGIDLAHPLDFARWSPLHWTIAAVLWAFFLWLSVHFPFGWLR